ncbi:hypothetical protein ALC57_13581 [Trachymyrmex cornetzi]|uniref:Uncharacterized protein n=1 Tax=Trachymyrmex cornetzi TaxID=471704 RepID=A0A195DPK5_9HYME|nr:hypothetical protein ALC57_13581 [Trachymyrmex cornetzi]
MPLRGTSTVLLKLKGGDHVLLHVASTCHSQDLPRKERWKMSVYFIAKKREGSKMESATISSLVLPDKSTGDSFPSPFFCDEVEKKLTSERSESPRLKERAVSPDCSV